MSLWGLVRRSVGFYWRTNLGVLLTVLVSTAVLTGALVVGDSVRYSLRRMVRVRLGDTQFALVGGNRLFRAGLGDDLSQELRSAVPPVLEMRGLITNSEGTKRANRIDLIGADERFYEIGAGGNPFGKEWDEGIVLNEPLAAKLGVGVGDEVVLRVDKPDVMPRDIPLTPDSDLSMAFRLTVRAIAGESDFGWFSLQANQVAPLNAYVRLEWLQGELGLAGRANVLLAAQNERGNLTVDGADEALKKCWRLADAGLELRRLEQQDVFEIRSSRVFIDEVLSEAALDASSGSVGILTYFVNELRLGDRTTPYSIVTGMGGSEQTAGVIASDMKDDEIVMNEWLADDLGAKVGDMIDLTYFVVGPMRKLQEEKSRFRVCRIVPIEGLAADRDLMPDFPGLSDADNCRDWEPGIPIDLDKIRKRDEDYWDNYRGTPKAFVTLEAGQEMWSNRYGNLTAVRYPADNELESVLAGKVLKPVAPASVGFYFVPIGAEGMNAGGGATDFGQLFLGFSMFLVISALLLTGLVFVFGVESRSEQTGMLLAVGYRPKLVKRLLLLEGGVLAAAGAIAGSAAGLVYTRAMIYGLSTVWRTAVSGSQIRFHAEPATLFIGAFAGTVVCLIAIWLTLRKQVSRPARELMTGNLEGQFFSGRTSSKRRVGFLVAAVAASGAVVLLIFGAGGDSGAAAGAFFGAGVLLLIGGIGFSRAMLRRIGSGFVSPMASLGGLGLRNSSRRSGRSLAVIGLLACGVFLVVAVGANRHDASAQAHERDSGTGGFALYGESAVGVLHDLNSKGGRSALGLDGSRLDGVKVVQLRVRDGDDASCLNLNRAQRPRLLGVNAQELQRRGAFGFRDVIEGADRIAGWGLLERDEGAGVVPAIGDYATVIWALGKSVGDELQYTDEKGRVFRVRIVGIINSSILQGSLVIAEENFVERFPSEDGYRVFLVDVPADDVGVSATQLAGPLRDFGLDLTPAAQRLADFNAVENTYLSIFQLLGGFGLILGSVGLGLVVLRNVLDRRGELGMLRAVGFSKGALKRMLFYEHTGLMLAGLVCGVVTALVAVAPALGSAGAEVPYFSLLLTIAAIGISGVIWIWIATVTSLHGGLLDALRNE
jgi:ABC-type antimicrobial peptide transport system permease subunit